MEDEVLQKKCSRKKCGHMKVTHSYYTHICLDDRCGCESFSEAQQKPRKAKGVPSATARQTKPVTGLVGAKRPSTRAARPKVMA